MAKTAYSSGTAAAVAGLVGLVALTAAGCGGGSGSSSGNGSLTVLMADAPPNLGNVSAVNVTVTKVEVHPSSSGTSGSGQDTPWKTVFQGSKKFNLLDLANQTDLARLPHIVDSGLPAGHYDQLRMVLDAAGCSIVVDGQTKPLVIPSGSETGLKARPFDVSSQQNTVLVLDFDVAKSVNLQGDGTYKCQPVINLNPVTLAEVNGKVVDASGAPMSAQVTLTNGTDTWDVITTTSGATPPAATDGVFAVHAVPSGTYTLTVSAQGKTTFTKTVTLTAPNVDSEGSITLN